MWQDVTFSLRLLRRSPGFALAAILTFALGIGANTAIFSVVDAAVLRPLPYDESQRLHTIVLHDPTTGGRTTGAMPRDFLDWRARKDIFEQVSLTGGGLYTLLGAGEPEQVRITRVTAGYFEMLRATPALGRTFTEDDELPGRQMVTIISDEFWKTRFAGDPDIVGETLRLDDEPHEIVGVLPASFRYPAGSAQQTRIFLPFTFTAKDRQRGIVQSMGYNPTARLRDGLSVAEAESAMSGLQTSLDADHAAFNKGYTRVELTPLIETYVADARAWMLTLLGAVSLVLLIACANVANLVLAHGTTRVRELTLRGALGATRWRLARQLLAESLCLSTAGAAAGLAVGWWSLGLLRATLPTSIPRAGDIGLDARVLGFTVALALLTGLVCGVAPAWQGSRLDYVRGLKDGAPGATSGKGGRRLRSALAVAEVALAVMLLVGAGLFVRSFIRLLNVDQGFDASGVVALQISAPRAADGYRAQMLEMLTSIRALPGVEAAVTESGGPFSGGYSAFPIQVPGRPGPGPNEEPEMIRFRKVSTGFLDMLRVPLLRGRLFTAEDATSAAPVAVINELAARRFWGEANPIGQSLAIEKTTYEIVGIVGNMRYGGPAAPPAPEAFLPFEQTARIGGTFIFRGPPASASAVRQAIWRVDPAQPIGEAQTAEQLFGRATASRRFNMLLMSIFATIAIAIAATGVYGVIAFLVSQRRREVGVRLALGARRSQVVALFVKHGAAVLATGIVVGLTGAWFLGAIVRNFLFDVDPRDVAVFGGVGLLLALVGLVACWIPAWRAGRLDPLAALRRE